MLSFLKHIFDGWPHIDLKNNSVNHWIWKYYSEFKNDAVIGITFDGENIIGFANYKQVKVHIKEVDKILISQMNIPLTILAAAGIGGVILLGIGAAMLSGDKTVEIGN